MQMRKYQFGEIKWDRNVVDLLKRRAWTFPNERSYLLWRENDFLPLISTPRLGSSALWLFGFLSVTFTSFSLLFNTAQTSSALHIWDFVTRHWELHKPSGSLHPTGLLNHTSVKRVSCWEWFCRSSGVQNCFWGCVVDCLPVSLREETTVTRRTLCSGRCH